MALRCPTFATVSQPSGHSSRTKWLLLGVKPTSSAADLALRLKRPAYLDRNLLPKSVQMCTLSLDIGLSSLPVFGHNLLFRFVMVGATEQRFSSWQPRGLPQFQGLPGVRRREPPQRLERLAHIGAVAAGAGRVAPAGKIRRCEIVQPPSAIATPTMAAPKATIASAVVHGGSPLR